MTMTATATTTAGQHGLIEVEVPPGFSPPLHVDHREDASFYVLDGRLTVRCAEETFAVTAGSYVFLPRDVPHGFVVEGETPVRMLNITTPGDGEEFFIEGGRPAESAGLPPAAPIDLDRLRRAGEHVGSEVLGAAAAPS
jgi:mannose-6-phosphate isomerase-like protein (cupin superfamily)